MPSLRETLIKALKARNIEEKKKIISSYYSSPSVKAKREEKIREIKTERGTVFTNPFLALRLSGYSGIVGKDVAGSYVTIGDVLEHSKNAPAGFDKPSSIEWSKQQLLGSKQFESKSSFPSVESPYKRYGYDISAEEKSEYAHVEELVRSRKEANIEALRSFVSFRQEFPSRYKEFLEAKKQYKAGLSYLSGLKEDDKVWFDVNRNLKQEPGEIMSKKEAIDFYMGQWIIKEGEYAGLSFDEYMSRMKELYISSPDIINRLRADISNLEYISSVLPVYREAGYNIDVSESGISFSPPSRKEVFESLYPGRSDILVAVAMTESFPIIVPIRAVVSGIGGFFTSGRSWDLYMESLYEKAISSTITVEERSKGLSGYLEHAKRFCDPFSMSGVGQNIYLPLATMGLGYGLSALRSGSSGLVASGRVSSVISSFGASNVGKVVYKGIIGGLAGVGVYSIGSGIVNISQLPPAESWVATGGLVQGIAQAIGGFYMGRSVFVSRYTPIVDVSTGKTPVIIEDISSTLVKDHVGGDFVTRGVARVIMPTRSGFLRYIYASESIGGDVSIGEKLHISDYIGFSKKSGYSGYNLFEGYNIFKNIGRYGEIDISFSKGGSAFYGRVPDVSISRGFSFFLRTTNIPESGGFKTIGVGKSIGILESKFMRGVYVSLGDVKVKPSIDINVIYADPSKLYSLSGLNNLKSSLLSAEKVLQMHTTVKDLSFKDFSSSSYIVGGSIGLFYLYDLYNIDTKEDIVYKTIVHSPSVSKRFNIDIKPSVLSKLSIQSQLKPTIGIFEPMKDLKDLSKQLQLPFVISIQSNILKTPSLLTSDIQLFSQIERQIQGTVLNDLLSPNVISHTLFSPTASFNFHPYIPSSLLHSSGGDFGDILYFKGKKKRMRKALITDIFYIDELINKIIGI